MENYLLRQLSELGIKTGQTGAVNSVYGACRTGKGKRFPGQ